jgi:hypothetical protein
VIALHTDGSAELSFNQSIEYKVIELFRCNFHIAKDDIVRKHVCFRYKLARFKMTLASDRLRDTAKTIKLKNPSLLSQIQKGAQFA